MCAKAGFDLSSELNQVAGPSSSCGSLGSGQRCFPEDIIGCFHPGEGE